MGLRRHGLLVWILGTAVWLTACGGLSSDFEGVYEVDEWTENLASCDSAGPSILEQQAELMVFAEVQSFFGTDYLGVSHCADVGECQAEAAEDTLDIFGYVLGEGNDDDGWSGYLSLTSPDGQGTCSGTIARYTLIGTTGAITIRSETSDIPPYPAMTTADDPNGCDYQDPLEATEGQPCVSLETLHATFTTDL